MLKNYKQAGEQYRRVLSRIVTEEQAAELKFKIAYCDFYSRSYLTELQQQGIKSTLDSMLSLPYKPAWLAQIHRLRGDLAFKERDFAKATHHYGNIVQVIEDEQQDLRLRLGISLKETGAYLLAIPHFKACLGKTVLDDYIGYWLAKAYLQADSLITALAELERLRKDHPRSLIRDKTGLLLGDTYLRHGSYHQALGVYEGMLKDKYYRRHAPEIWYRMGVAHSALKNRKESQGYYYKVMTKYPGTEWGWKARMQFIDIKKQSGQELTGEEIYYNALVLASHDQLPTAINQYQLYLKKYPPSAQWAETIYQIGKAYYYLEDFDRAENYFRKIITRLPGHSLASTAQLYIARCRKGKGQFDQARDEYRIFINRHPKHPKAAGALWYIGWHYELDGDYAQAIKIYQQFVQEYRHSVYFDEARWRVGYCHYKLKQYETARDVFNSLQKNQDIHLEDQARYWLGKTYLQWGRPEEANRTFSKMLGNYPRTYYAARAAFRLDSLKVARRPLGLFAQTIDPTVLYTDQLAQFGKQVLQVPPATAIPLHDHHYLKGRVLLDLGLTQEATTELFEVERKHRKNIPVLFKLANDYAHHGIFHRAYKASYKLLGRFYKTDIEDFPFSSLRLLFPLAYYEEVVAQCHTYRNVDPFFVLAIIHQESRFNPRSRSGAGAVGLMQIIPRTAATLASELGLEHFNPVMLEEPATSLEFGIRYLSGQLHNFQEHLEPTLAAYNGGPINVKRWQLSTPPDDIDQFLEEIEFRETRNYVKNVMRNYRIYYELWQSFCRKQEQAVPMKK